MFLGQVSLTMDEKGRIVLPAVYRDQLHGPITFALGEHREIAIWPEEGFREKYEAKLAAERSGADDGGIEFRRFTANASQVKMDAQYRIAIPENLRTKRNLGRELTMVGAGTRLELWNTADLAEYFGEAS